MGPGRGPVAGRARLNREGTMLGAMPTTTRAEGLYAAIRAARDIDEVVRATARVRELPRPMLDEGTAPEAITALVTGVNDLVTTRLIELTGLDAALRTGLYPFLPADIVKICLAAGVMPSIWALLGRRSSSGDSRPQDQ